MALQPHLTTGNFWRDMRVVARERLSQIDRPGWRRFFLALFALAFAFFLALSSAALNEAGRPEYAALCAVLSLVLAGIVAVKVVPYLARRTALERWMVKIEYDFTREGAVYLAIIAVIIISALNTGNNLLFIILASLLAGILVSGILSKIVLSDLELDFALPEHLFASQPMLSRLTLQNLKWFFPSFSILVAAKELKRGRRSKTPPAPARQILDAPVYVPYVPRRSMVTQRVELTFPRRGRYSQEGFSVSTKFPFGLLQKTREVPARQEILVLPSIEPTEEFYEILPLIAGEVESYFKGRGHDLYSIRDYQESDSVRHIDWKASARSQGLKVREFTREDERRLVLVFDERIPEERPETLEKFEKAVNLCAGLAWHFYEIDAQMQFLSGGIETEMAPASEVVYPALEALALIEPKLLTSRDGGAESNPLVQSLAAERGFKIILTCQSRGSIATSLWTSSYFIFYNSL